MLLRAVCSGAPAAKLACSQSLIAWHEGVTGASQASSLHKFRNDALEDLPDSTCDLEIRGFEILGALRIFCA